MTPRPSTTRLLLRRLRRVRRIAWPVRLIALYGAAYATFLIVAAETSEAARQVATFGPALLDAAILGLAWRVRPPRDLAPRRSWAWSLVGVAAGVTFLANAYSAVAAAAGLAAPPPAAHVVAELAIVAAIVLLSGRATSRRDASMLVLDVGTIAAGAAMLVIRFAIPPDIPGFAAWRQSGGDTVVFAGPLLLAGIAAALLRCPAGLRRPPIVLLAGAAAAEIFGDVLLAHLAITGAGISAFVGAVVHLPWYVLFASAALFEKRRRELDRVEDDDEGDVRSFLALPHLSLVGCLAVLVETVARRPGSSLLLPLTLTAAAGSTFAIGRQILSLRENLRLRRDRVVLAAEARFKSLVQRSADVVTILDADWTITYVSPSVVAALGYQTIEILGRRFLELVHPDDAADSARRLQESVVDPQRHMTARWRLQRKDGTPLPTENLCTNMMGDENVRGLVVNSRDISERVSLEQQLEHQAFHDPLTGLANRALFQDRVHHALSRRRGYLDTLGVLFIDLDDFKSVNDSLGHASGDRLLKASAQRLVECLRVFDTAARLGGDEFAVLIDDTLRREHVLTVAERIAKAFRAPFSLDGRDVSSSASVGVALALPDQTAEDLLRNADLAMYLAKSRGRGQAALFDPSMHTAALNRLELQADLRYALQHEELSLVYQPVHSLETQRLIGAEALLRWHHPTRGAIPPSIFVPLAEETGLIVPIGRWVLHHACRDASRWSVPEGRRPLRVSVNLSNRQLPEAALFDDVQSALKDSGLTASRLVLELTESILLQQSDQALSVINRLRLQGIRVAIDDFGTGYSSLSYLQRLPVDILKIDRAFIERIEVDEGAAALTRAIVALGRSMSLTTVAEGIESALQAEKLRKLGCTLGQGFFYGVPMTAPDLEAYARRCSALSAA